MNEEKVECTTVATLKQMMWNNNSLLSLPLLFQVPLVETKRRILKSWKVNSLREGVGGASETLGIVLKYSPCIFK